MAFQRNQADPYLFSIPQKLGGKKEIIFLLSRSAVSNPLSELCLCSMEMKQKMKRFCGEALKREEETVNFSRKLYRKFHLIVKNLTAN